MSAQLVISSQLLHTVPATFQLIESSLWFGLAKSALTPFLVFHDFNPKTYNETTPLN